MNTPASYIAVDWNAPQNVGATFTTRSGGHSQEPYRSFNLATHVGDSEINVYRNRAKLMAEQQLESVCWLNQVHGVDVVEAKRQEQGRVLTADASYSRSPGLACAIMVADCMPVLVTDRQGTCVGAAHAGWRGLCSGVIPNLISRMNIGMDQAICWLGPCIGSRAFEVGPEVKLEFEQSPAFRGLDSSQGFSPGDSDRYFADLGHLAKVQLAAMGVQTVFSQNTCTYEDAVHFFSHRRDVSSRQAEQTSTGRMAALIWLEKQSSFFRQDLISK